MKKSLLLFVTGIVAVLLLLELVFRLFSVLTATRTGYYIDPLILTYPPHHCFTVATGWDLKNAQYHCANNLGFLDQHDFVNNPQAIALIGDSFVEANMLPMRERLAPQLELRLGGTQVYAMGGPGSSLLDYAERAKFARERFGTRTFVFILERSDIRQALCGSGNIHGPCIDAHSNLLKTEVQLPPNIVKRVIRESAVAQYIFSQLKFDFAKAFGKMLAPEMKQNVGPSVQRPPLLASEQVIARFFKQLESIGNASFYFLIDTDRAHRFDQVDIDSEELRDFRRTAQSIHANVIDPAAAFREFVSKSGLALEVGPYDRHWNSAAVQIVAEKIAAELRVTK